MGNLILNMMNVCKIKLHKIFSLIFIFNLIVVLCSCKQEEVIQNEFIPKPDTLMPNYTDTGANVLAFRINGRMVISEDRIQRTRSIASGYIVNSEDGSPFFFIEGGYNAYGRNEEISLVLDYVSDTGIYIVKESTIINNNQGQYRVGRSSSDRLYYTTRDNYPGTVHIKKIDTINHIIAGTFEFKAQLFLLGDDVVTITDGRFDVYYK